jgi:hypothetical protein
MWLLCLRSIRWANSNFEPAGGCGIILAVRLECLLKATAKQKPQKEEGMASQVIEKASARTWGTRGHPTLLIFRVFF